MKKITKIIYALLGISVLLVTSCTEDPVIREESPAEGNQYLVYFPTTNSTDVTVTAEATSYTYTISRSNKSGSITVPLTSASDAPFTVPTSVTFADGSATANVTITFAPLTSEPKRVIINIDPQYAALYAIGHPQFSGTIKAINWVSLGNGQFYDAWVMYSVVTVEVKKAQGMDRYRIMNPYPQSILEEAEWGNWIGGPKSDFIEFWIKSDKTIAWDKFWYPGLLYQGSSTAIIKGYLPSALSASQAAKDANSKVLITDKLFTLCPYYYIDGLGGFGVQNTWLSLPGGPDLYEYLDL